jgi:hypothetical protein
MVYKKSKRNIKNRRKTKRKQKGGSIINIVRLTNKNGIPMANLIENQSYSQSPKYGEMVLSNRKFGIIPYYSSFSMMDLLPELNGEENDLIDLITGKQVNGLQSKQKMIYNHTARDMQMFALNQVFLNKIDTKINNQDDFTKEMIRILTKTDLYKKILCLRILVYIYFGKNGINPDKDDINNSITSIDDIHINPIFNHELRVDVIPQDENGKTYYQKDFDFIKQYFKFGPDITKISTNIYSNRLLIKCYKDITDDDITSIMNRLPDNKIYSLVYSEKNKGTYDNIRYLLINASIISQALTGMVNMEALITPGNRAVAAANLLVNREAEARQTAITAVIAAIEHNRLGLAPGLAPGQIQNENVAIIAALAAMENNRPNPGPARQNIPPAINNAALAAIVAANP